MEHIHSFVLYYLPKILLGIFVLIVGNWLIKQLLKFLRSKLNNYVDPTVIPFLLSFAEFLFKATLLIAVLRLFSINTTPFIAILSSVGLAVGLALQDSLMSFANGFLLLILKPFKIGDRITTGEITGNVEKIGHLSTVIRTLDNKQIHIENGQLLSNPIVNHSAYGLIRVDMQITVSMTEDITKIRQIISNVAARSLHSLKEPEVLVNNFNGAGICFDARIWCIPENYWAVYYFMREEVKRQFTLQHVELPIEDMKVDYDITINFKDRMS